jgi:hypothetical protein
MQNAGMQEFSINFLFRISDIELNFQIFDLFLRVPLYDLYRLVFKKIIPAF